MAIAEFAEAYSVHIAADSCSFMCQQVMYVHSRARRGASAGNGGTSKSAGGAERLFTAEYGDLPGDAELVIEIDKPPEWLTKSCWLGPDPDLTEFGGTKLHTIDFPRWQFGGRVWGSRKTMTARYHRLKE